MTPWTEAQQRLLTIRDLIRFAMTRLASSGLFFGHGYPGPLEEARHLVLNTLALPFEPVADWLDARLLPDERRQILKRLRRRCEERIPLAYLTREAWLGPFRFYTDERVIVPRSFIAEALDHGLDFLIEDFASLERVADICTGGGSLAVLLALKCPEALVDATDLSAEALEVARINRADYGLEDRIALHQGDLYSALDRNAYDLIVANPPYVDDLAMDALPREYHHEPVLALASGTDGLDHTRRLLEQGAAHLRPQGWLVVEVGHQAEVLEAAFPTLPFLWLELPSGPRYVFAIRREDLVLGLRT